MIEILNVRDVFTIRSSMTISPAPTDTGTAIATIPSFCIELKPIYHSPLLKSRKHDNISEKEVKNMEVHWKNDQISIRETENHAEI